MAKSQANNSKTATKTMKPSATSAKPKNISKKVTKTKEGAKSATTKKKITKRKTVIEDSPYERPFLNEMKEMLMQMRIKLLQDVSRSVRAESDHLRFDVGDFYDHASNDRERELALTLSDRERDRLFTIDDALKRIDEGTYGVCEITGEPIGEGRLRALPFTKLSVEAQEEIEKYGE